MGTRTIYRKYHDSTEKVWGLEQYRKYHDNTEKVWG